MFCRKSVNLIGSSTVLYSPIEHNDCMLEERIVIF